MGSPLPSTGSVSPSRSTVMPAARYRRSESRFAHGARSGSPPVRPARNASSPPGSARYSRPSYCSETPVMPTSGTNTAASGPDTISTAGSPRNRRSRACAPDDTWLLRIREVGVVVLPEQCFFFGLLREHEEHQRRTDQNGDDACRVGPVGTVEERRLRGGGDLVRVLRELTGDALRAAERLLQLILGRIGDLRGVRCGRDRGCHRGCITRGEQ